MGRPEVWTLILVLLLVSTSSPIEATAADDGPTASGPFTIDGDSELASSIFLQGGNGSISNPYVLSGIPYDAGGLVVKNITSWVKIWSQRIDTDADGYPLIVEDVRGCILDNVSITDDQYLLDVRGKTNFTIISSNFLCTRVEGTGIYPVAIGTSQVVSVANSSFRSVHVENVEYGFTNYYAILGEHISVSGSNFSKVKLMLKVPDIGHSFSVTDCRFDNNSILIPQGYWGNSTKWIMSSEFHGSYIDVRDCYGYRIINSSFLRPGSGIMFGWSSTPFMPELYSLVKGNTFENSDGLHVSTLYSTRKYIRKVHITENYFGNCSSGAIFFRYMMDIDFVFIWKNIFYHNRGTGDTYSNMSQADTEHGFLNLSGNTYQYYRDGLGNYWRDWTGPDDDNNGIVDSEYVVEKGSGPQYTKNVSDRFPVTNPLFDVERPGLRITEPAGPLTNYRMDYVRVEWEAWDDLSGLDRVMISGDGENWTDVTSEDWWPMRLEQGKNTVHMIAYDKAGLYNRTQRTIEVKGITGPVVLLFPEDGDILLTEEVKVKWFVDEYFPLSDQELWMDRDPLDVDLDTREVDLVLPEGGHHVELSCGDTKGLTISDRADFIVDTSPPTVEIFTPHDVTTYSRDLVNFTFSAKDVNGLAQVYYRIDHDNWTNIDDPGYCSFKKLLSGGTHTFEVRAVDNAGRMTVERVSFSIGEGTLQIISPEDGHETGEDHVVIRWTIRDDFDPVAVEFEDINRKTKVSVTDFFEYQVMLTSREYFNFKVTARDAHGNEVWDTIKVNRDLKPPIIEIQNKAPAVNDDPLTIWWMGWDHFGVMGYAYRMDSVEWTECGNSTGIEFRDLSESEHVFEVRCLDIAGNSAVDTYQFTYDLTPPVVGFEGNDGHLIRQDPFISLYWTASDENGLSSVQLTVGERTYDLPAAKRFWEGILEDGTIKARINVSDTAGNTAEDWMFVTVDTEDPVAKWVDGIISPTNQEELTIIWRTYDNIDIVEVNLFEDGVKIHSRNKPGRFDLNLTPEDGAHFYQVIAFDISRRSVSIERTIVVDREAPVIDIFDHEYRKNVLVVIWSTHDETTSVTSVVIRVGDQKYDSQARDHSCSFEDLEPGHYIIWIEVTDEAWNTRTERKDIEIEPASGWEDDQRSGILLLVLVILMVAVIAGASLGVFFYLRKIEKEKGSEDEKEEMKPPAALPPSGKRSQRMLMGQRMKAPPKLGPVAFEGEDGPDRL
ncbi:MAG: hypothetical protein ACMUHM_07645 [Thermoplasmatota archaeon]